MNRKKELSSVIKRVVSDEYSIILSGFINGFLWYGVCPLSLITLLGIFIPSVKELGKVHLVIFFDVKALYIFLVFFTINMLVAEILNRSRWFKKCLDSYGFFIGIIFAVALFGLVNGFCSWFDLINLYIAFLSISIGICVLHFFVYRIYSISLCPLNRWKELSKNTIFAVIVISVIYLSIVHPVILKYIKFLSISVSIITLAVLFFVFRKKS